LNSRLKKVSPVRRGPALILLGSLLLGAAWAGAESTRSTWALLSNYNPPPVTQPVAETTPALTRRVLWLSIEGLSPREANLMPTLQWLAGRGARLSLTGTEPLTPAATFATLLTGAPPTVHGVMLPGRTAPLGAETILGAAQRGKLAGRLIGSPLGAPLPDEAEARQKAIKAAAADPEALTLIALDDLATAQKRLGLADPAQAEYRQVVAALDGLLLNLLEGIDLTKTTLVVTGALPTSADGRHLLTESGLLVAAGPGVQPGARGQAALVDLAPTVATLLGAPLPAHGTGQPILALIDQNGRLPDALTATYMQTRQAALQGALTKLGRAEVLPAPPKAAAEASGYVASLERYVAQTDRYLRVSAWKERIVGPGILLLVVLLYLIVLGFQPIARSVWQGALLYLIVLPALLVLTGGRYAYLGGGLADWGRPSLFQLAGMGLVATALAGAWTGYSLSRKGFKRGDYLATAGLHLHLLLVALTALPLLIGWILLGGAPLATLPSLPVLGLVLLLLAQIPFLGVLSLLTAVWTTFVSRTATQLWPLPEVGNPEENADKVVRLRALRRSSQQPTKRTRKG
jgi:hypothetical protein